MTKLVVDITTSLDGFIAGTGISNDLPMGKNGELLHHWIFKDKTELDSSILYRLVESTGAIILGNRMYSTAIDIAWGGVTPFAAPSIVMCHREPEKKVQGFEYITSGMHDALLHARKQAGEKNIWIIGGANVIQQFFKAGLVDLVNLHIAPVLMNQGTRLFDVNENELTRLKKMQVLETPGAIHINYHIK